MRCFGTPSNESEWRIRQAYFYFLPQGSFTMDLVICNSNSLRKTELAKQISRSTLTLICLRE